MMGIVIGLAMPTIVNQSFYRLTMIVLGILLMVGVIITRAPRQTFAIFLVIAIPLNLSFTPFGEAPWHSGGAQAVQVVYLYDVPLIGLIVFWALYSIATRRPGHITPTEFAYLAFIVWGLLSIQNSTEPQLTIMEVIRMFKLLLLGHVIANTVITTSIVKRILIALMLGLVIQSAFAFLQFSFEIDFGGIGFVVGDVRRVSGTIGWPNTLGAYAAAVLCIPVAMWMASAYRPYRLALTAVIVVGTVPLALSLSRGAWVALAIAVLAMYLLSLIRRFISLYGFAIQMLVLACIVAAGGILLSEQIQERAAEDTLSVRAYLNEIALSMTESEPLVGIGLNTFVETMRDYDRRNVYAYFPEPVHNIFLLTMAETGIVGLGLFLSSIVFALRSAWEVIRHAEPEHAVATIGLVGALIALMVSNLSDVHLRTDVLYALWWVFIGLILGMQRTTSANKTRQPVVSNADKELRLWHENRSPRLWT